MIKRPMREAMYQHVSLELIQPLAIDFDSSIRLWLSGLLRHVVEVLFADMRLKDRWLLQCCTYLSLMLERSSGGKLAFLHFKRSLMFQAWFEEQRG
jgi:hypothetical protein